MVRNLENTVCDEHAAVEADHQGGSIPDCVKGGFIGGYLLSMVIPEFSANALLGARLLNRRLEAGLRISYHRKHENDDFDRYIEAMVGNGYNPSAALPYRNLPMSWDDITVFDAYVNWKFSDQFSAELTGTNLRDLYYVDPLTRSAYPAPGRTLKLSVAYRF